ncbi:MAG: glycosyltransferase family 4 protein, partial [Symploca sp. SIO3E6]|nr:glycosyltransferase family 4 protein [Caldora sp. SIO3E6]
AWKQSHLNEQSKLLIIGDGPLTASLMPFYGKEHGIIWWGFEADEQRRIDLLRSADVFILPSLLEGLSLSLLEAMACGIACVATDAGADGEVLEAGAGVVLNTHRVTSQLQTLLPVLNDHQEWTDLLGKKARARVLERYTLSSNITGLEKLYTKVRQTQWEQLSNSGSTIF